MKNAETLSVTTPKEQTKLRNRVRRLRGQLDAVERSIDARADCANILMLLAACRGGVNGLMAEILEEHIRHHLVGKRTREASQDLADDLIDIVHAYFR